MSRRIYSWAGRVCVALDHDGARHAFGIPASIKATIYDLTDGLRVLADEVLLPVVFMGGGVVDSSGRQTFAELQATLETVCRQLTEVSEANADQRIEIETLHTSLTARQGEVDKLRELVKLYEDSAEQAERAAEQAQSMAAWEAEQKVLSSERRKRIVEPVVIIQDLPSDAPLSSEVAAETHTLPAIEQPPQPVAGGCDPLPDSQPDAVCLPAPTPACEAPPSPESGPAPETGSADDSTTRRKKIEDAIRSGFIAGQDWDAIAKAASQFGKRLTSGAVKIRAQKMGLRAADRLVQLPRGPKSPTGRAIVKAVTPTPATVPVKSRLVAMWGKMVQEYQNQGYDPDEIVEKINAEVAKADRVTGQQVRQIQQELKRLARDGVAL